MEYKTQQKELCGGKSFYNLNQNKNKSWFLRKLHPFHIQT